MVIQRAARAVVGTLMRSVRRALFNGQSPINLFAAGEQGAWYDPSDFARYMAPGPELSDAVGLTLSASRYGTSMPLVFNRAYLVTAIVEKVSGTSIDVGVTGTSFAWQPGASQGVTANGTTAVYRVFYASADATAQPTVIFTAAVGTVKSLSVREIPNIATASLYQDAAGTTPVTAVEQPVGLMLDKRLGLVRGPELVSDPGFDTPASWAITQPTAGSVAVAGGACTINTTDGTYAAAAPLPGVAATVGKTYELVVTVATVTAGAFTVEMGGAQALGWATPGTYRWQVTATTTAGPAVKRANGGQAANFVVTSFSVRELPGNHASQSTAAARPVLSARKNLLTDTATMQATTWVDGNVTSTTANARDGTAVAQKIVPTTALTTHNYQYNWSGFTIPVGATYTWAVEVKAEGAYTRVGLWHANTGASSIVDLVGAGSVAVSTAGVTTAITALGDGWYRVASTYAQPSAAAPAVRVYVVEAGQTNLAIAWSVPADGVSGILIAFPQVEYGPTATRYQRVNTATDYDWAGFPLYLKYDGVDDKLLVPGLETMMDNSNAWTVLTAVQRTGGAGWPQLAAKNQAASPRTGASATITDSSGNLGTERVIAGSFLTTATVVGAAPTGETLVALHGYDGAASHVRKNLGTAVTTAAAGSLGAGSAMPFGIGTNLAGNIYGQVLRAALVPAGASRDSAARHLANKAGVTL